MISSSFLLFNKKIVLVPFAVRQKNEAPANHAAVHKSVDILWAGHKKYTKNATPYLLLLIYRVRRKKNPAECSKRLFFTREVVGKNEKGVIFHSSHRQPPV